MDVGVLMMEPLVSAGQWRDRVRRVEDSGAAALQVSDHFDRSPVSPLIALAAAAQHTDRLRLGTLVLNNDFRHPAVLAKELASLQLLCDGRLEVGLGAGWMDEDYTISGIVREPAGRRVDRLAGTVRLLKTVLGAGAGPVDAAEEHCSVTGYRNVPPVTAAPPLLVGGGGRRVLTVAGRYADIVSVNFDLREGRAATHAARSAAAEATEEKLSWVREAAGGRSPLLHLIAYWAEVTERPAEAAARRIAALGLGITPEEMLASPHCLIGPRGAVAERLAELEERWGFGYVTLYEADLPSFAPVIGG